MITLDRITIFPVKSLDGVVVDACQVLAAGGLENDRRWQLTDMDGRVMNAKRAPLLHAIRTEFDLASPDGPAGVPRLAANSITLSVDPAALAAAAVPGCERLAALADETFPLVPGPDGPCDWLSHALGTQVLLLERRDGGFPDDREAPGPTLVSTASLEEVGRWFGLGLDEVRRRFRINLEVGGCDAFWEDSLASPARPELAPSLLDLPAELAVDPYADLPPPEPRRFTIGEVGFRATNVCRRCPVPGRDSRTGSFKELFRDVFEARRRRSLRPDVDAAAWETLYRLGINTRVESAGTVRSGDTATCS
jgi:uncharacterized protein YcbX